MARFWKRWRRSLLANIRVVILLWQRFRLSLSLFLAIIVLGSLILWLGYVHPQEGTRLTFPEALYAAFSMIFFQPSIPFPQGPLEILFFIIPILGLSIVAEGLLSFGVLLLDRRNPTGEWSMALASTYSGHIIVCGLGHVGFRVARQLVDFGQEVVGIEKNPQSPFLERLRRMGVPVILGEANHPEILEQAGVKRARAVVVATNNDLLNLDIVMHVRELNPEARLVLRLFDAELAERVGRVLGIHTAFSASAIAAPAFATAAIHEGVTHSFFLEGELLNLSEVVVLPGGGLEGRSVQEVEEMLDLSVVFHQRGGRRDMHPAAELRLEAGDKVVVFATLEQLKQIERLNCPRR